MLSVVRLWILLSTLLVSAGWILSALHQLNRLGYGIIFALTAIGLAYGRKKNGWLAGNKLMPAGHKLWQRFKRPAPQLFLALAFLTALAGFLYVSTDINSNTYRTPRMLHWLGREQWHWIHTADSRMNIASCGFEWLATPLMLFTRTDRFIFLINVVSYLMLPGLIFSVFTRLQVRPRVAWWWMWLLASGWCYVFQAGSDANDSFAAIYALAAVDLALRAREKKSVTDLWLSLLAAALVTGAKQTNLPLVLLWLLAAWPGRKLLRTRPLGSTLAVAAGLLVSIVPISVFNFQHYGTWMPVNASVAASLGNFHLNPFWGIVGNLFCLPLQNLLPPFFPWTEAWNGMMQRFVATPFGSHFASFEYFGRVSAGMHGVGQTNAGIGLGICVLTLVSIWAASRHLRNISKMGGLEIRPGLRLLRWTPWLLLLVFMAKVGTYENARHLAPYYAFFFPVFLTETGQTQLVRQCWWQRFGLLVMLFTVAILVVSRNHPLLPARTILSQLKQKYPDSKLVARALFSFTAQSSTQTQRDFFATNLPADERLIGYAGNAGEPPLWLPLGQRRVERVLAGDTPGQLRAQGIHYVVVEGDELVAEKLTVDQWLDKYDGQLVNQLAFTTEPDHPPHRVYVVVLKELNPRSHDPE
jgi:hypothetical protein